MKTCMIGVGLCGLHKRTPYGIVDVSRSQFSIARHYGGIKYNGDEYVYFPETDELIRDDVLRWQKKQNRKQPVLESEKQEALL